MITLYTLPDCQLCEKMKEWLTAAGYEFQVRDMNDPADLAAMRIGGCFEVVAPVLEIEGRFYSSEQCQDRSFISTVFGENVPVNAPEIPEVGGHYGNLETFREDEQIAQQARAEDITAPPIYIQAEVITGRYAPDLYVEMEKTLGTENVPKCLHRDTTLTNGHVLLDVLISGRRFDMELVYK